MDRGAWQGTVHRAPFSKVEAVPCLVRRNKRKQTPLWNAATGKGRVPVRSPHVFIYSEGEIKHCHKRTGGSLGPCVCIHEGEQAWEYTTACTVHVAVYNVYTYMHMCAYARVSLSGCSCVFLLDHKCLHICTGGHMCACVPVIWACGHVTMTV